VVRAGDS